MLMMLTRAIIRVLTMKYKVMICDLLNVAHVAVMNIQQTKEIEHAPAYTFSALLQSSLLKARLGQGDAHDPTAASTCASGLCVCCVCDWGGEWETEEEGRREREKGVVGERGRGALPVHPRSAKGKGTGARPV